MKKLILFIVMVFVVTGCAKVQVKEELKHSWHQNEVMVKALNSWELQGKIFVTDGKKGNNALIAWNNQGKNYNVKVHAPVGGDYVILAKLADNNYELTEANGEKLQALSMESLMQQKLGWYIPLSGLNTWIKGVPLQSKISIIKRYPDNTIEFLQQNGWDINYSEYKNFKDVYLPTKIQLSHDNILIKMFIRNWELH